MHWILKSICLSIFHRCTLDRRKKYANLVSNIYIGVSLATFATCITCYLLVWFKIRSVAANIKNAKHGGQKNTRTAKMMMVFVLVYISQWSPLVVFHLWSYCCFPHDIVFVWTVLFVNLGGFFNCVAYTLIRRKKKTDEKLHISNTTSAARAYSIPART